MAQRELAESKGEKQRPLMEPGPSATLLTKCMTQSLLLVLRPLSVLSFRKAGTQATLMGMREVFFQELALMTISLHLTSAIRVHGCVPGCQLALISHVLSC